MLRRPLLAAALVSLLAPALLADTDPSIPTPESVLGQKPGADFYLASYDESLRYFQKLDQASDRVMLRRVGRTSFGLEWHIALISSPQNLADLERHVEISRRTAWARDVDDEQARALAREGRAIVHIDGGLHATEVACAQHTIALAYRLASTRGDPITDAILDRVILVLWFSINPDGQNMVASWYRRNLGTPYEVAPLPWLYQKYVGHDNNRDGYMNNTHEMQVVTATSLGLQPHVFYNHHQTAPFPARIWIPPFAEPVSTSTHPLMWRQVNLFGTAMAAWLDERGREGAMHRGNGFDDWYPGFIDHTNSFRHTVSFLTETALYRYATPHFYTVSDFPRSHRDLRPEALYPSPWKGGWWRLGDAVDYMIEASMSVLDTAAKYKDSLIYNRYQAGRDTIRRYREEPPFAYVIPQDQHDRSSAARLVEVFLTNGLEVHRATRPFRANGLEYAAGDVVVLMDQPFARLAEELLKVQDYPELRPGGPDAPLDLPYDVAGWTLPIQMHVDCDEVRMPLDGAARAAMELVDAPPYHEGGVTGDGPTYRVPRAWNDTARVLNAAWDRGATVRIDDEHVYVDGLERAAVDELSRSHHVPGEAATAPDSAIAVARPRIGVYRPWTASIDEGWTRWLLDTYGFAYESLYNEQVLAGRLRDRFDVILIADISGRTIREGHARGTIPGEFAGGLGDRGVAHLRDFVEDGGTLVCFDGSARFAIEAFALKLKDPTEGKKRDEFFCAGSLLRTEASGEHPLLKGMQDPVAVMFTSSATFEPTDGFEGRVVLSYPEHHEVLLSGFLLGDDVLRGKAALVEAEYGEGRLVLFGFRPQWRGQPHGTFKLVFNALLYTRDVAEALAPEEEEDAEATGERESEDDGR